MNDNLKNREDELITTSHPKSPVAESFRSIRTNLNFISPDDPLESMLITSSGSGEGKSLITSNVAVSLAQNGKKIIIIDADMRKPMQHRFYAAANLKGLSDILTGEIEFRDGLIETGIEGLELITAGSIPPNPSELLDSHKMEEVLTAAKERTDMVIIDTPPVLAVTDAVLLSTKVDGTVIVVASQRTHNDMLVKAQMKLERVNANIVGTILNRFPVQKQGNYYYRDYYRKYYSYYGKEKNEETSASR